MTKFTSSYGYVETMASPLFYRAVTHAITRTICIGASQRLH